VLNVERESPLNVTLLQGIARGDKMDTIVQKATQLGVTRITPLLLQRSNVRLDAEVSKRKQAHWQGVLESACEQCGRNRLPLLTPPTSLQSALAELTDGLKLLLAPRDDSPSLSSLVGSRDLGAPIYLLVGPEGGLAPNEIEAAVAAGFVECRLGPRILRTETAALAALAALQALAGDYQ
jgi:16S rRNA (uracil1498-N3)-methyltransferase